MKKKLIAVAIIAVMTLTAGFLTAASEDKAGGYSYKDANGQIDLAGYFTVEGADISMAEESIDFCLTGAEATISFNKPLAADGFSLSFAGVEDNTLQKAEMTITDVENAEEELKFTFSRLNDLYSGFTVNGASRSYMANGAIYSENDAAFVVAYDEDTKSVDYGSNYRIPIMENAGGGAFKGFTTGRVSLSIRLMGEKGSIFRLTEINLQRMGSRYCEDNVIPMICITNPVESAMKGTTITLPTAFAMDVLADNATVTMTVKAPDGNVVKDTDGKELSKVTAGKAYRIKIEQYGNYNLEYVATDGTNTTRTIVTSIRVLDETAPELQLKKSVPVSHKVGDKLTFPELILSDNVTENDKIVTWVTVIHPDGTMTQEKNSMEFLQEGVYEISFQAMDEAGNITFVTTKTYAEGE